MSYRKSLNLELYFIADPSCCGGRDITDVVRAAVQGGVTMVQYRNKNAKADSLYDEALRIQSVLSGAGVPFIVNDHVDLAAEIDADGVHIGQGDMPPAQARDIIGADKILGLTAFTREHYAAINPELVDYVGTGPVFPTKTDKGKPVLGVDGFAGLIQYAPVPVVGIGGITAENTRSVIDAGAQGVAMMRSISLADDPCMAAQDLLKSRS